MLCWMSYLLNYSRKIYLTSEMSMFHMKWEHVIIFSFTLYHVNGMHFLED